MTDKNKTDYNNTTLFVQFFAESAYRFVVTATRHCPLSRKQLEVYSALMKADFPVSVARLAKVTGLTRKTVKRNLKALEKHGLAALENDRWIVRPPNKDQYKWFAWKPNGAEWRKRLRKWKVLRLAQKTKLTDAENTLYSMLVSLAGTKQIVEISIKRLAKLARVARKTARKAIARLVELELILKGDGRVKLLEPSNLDDWQQIKKKSLKQQKPQVEPVEIISVPSGYFSRAMRFPDDSLAALRAEEVGKVFIEIGIPKREALNHLISLHRSSKVVCGDNMLFDIGTVSEIVRDWLAMYSKSYGLTGRQWIAQCVRKQCRGN